MKKRKEREQENNQLNKPSMEPLYILIKKTQRLLLSTQKRKRNSTLISIIFSYQTLLPSLKKKMAEAFAADIAKSLLGKLGSFAVQELRLAWGLEDDLARLEERLKAINAVLSDAEKQQSKNKRIRLWLHMLREVLYDAEDVLDEIECETLRRQVVKTTGSTSRKVQHFFTSSNMIPFRLKMGHKIKKIIERLAEISSLKSEFNLSEQAIDCRHVLQEETEMNRSFESFSGLIGRDKDKERIINLLAAPSKVGDAHPFVLPIVGMGGLGKTSLAKSVCDAENVKSHFELKMEVCVSDDFSLKQVMQKIIKSATGERCADLDGGELNKKLEEIVNGRKYLLLLDDVWNEDAQKWLLLKPLLSKGADGSKIIVTTRSQRVAEIMGTVAADNLSLLGQEDCLSLFYKCAFKEGEKELYPNLVGIGKEIVAKCKQVPLAVINLGKLAKIKRLPKSIFKLQNLQALLTGDGLEELPKDVRHMISLRFLFLITKQKRFPEGGIGCLECLQTLFIVRCENLENLCEDMQGLKSLRKLIIISCGRLISLPRSIKCLTTLEELFIINCKKLDLITKEEEKEEKIQPLSLSLRIVMFRKLPATLALPEQLLQGSAESLQTFIITYCPNIREMPDCIDNLNKLQNLEISDCPSLSKRCRRGTGEDWPKIKHIPKIKNDGDDSGEETSHAGSSGTP